MLIDGVVRNLEIIGEAAKNIPLAVKEKYPSLPWREMAGMRDKMAHDYFGVDLNIVWKTVKDSIPKIKSVIKTIIE